MTSYVHRLPSDFGVDALTSRRRVHALLAVAAVIAAIASARLIQVQGISAESYARRGVNQRLATIDLPAERGSIFDRNGIELALSTQQESVSANPRAISDPARYAALLAPALGVQPLALAQRLMNKKLVFTYLARTLDDATAERVRQVVKSNKLVGIDFQLEPKRQYPSGALAAPLLGLVGTENKGLGGIEYAYESVLAGRAGSLVVERDRQGREIPGGLRHSTQAARGRDLVLSIDQAMQFEIEQRLTQEVASAKAKGGMAIVMDLPTGDLLAVANVVGAVKGVPAHPAPAATANRAITDVYEPGSTNKIIIMAAALEQKTITPGSWFRVADKLQVSDHVFRDDETHPTVGWQAKDILAHSSNVGTILIAQRLGKEQIDRSLRSFGFGQQTGVGFPGEPRGILLDPKKWYGTSMATVPIGNGLAVTPLQMLDVYATVANGGVWRQPRLVTATMDASGVRHELPLGKTRRVISRSTADQINSMLQTVVNEGTGVEAQIPGYAVAGKTGTAQKALPGTRGYSNKYIASFVGFAPADRPRLAAAVILDEPTTQIYGGAVAAPVFARLMEFALRADRITPSDPSK